MVQLRRYGVLRHVRILRQSRVSSGGREAPRFARSHSASRRRARKSFAAAYLDAEEAAERPRSTLARERIQDLEGQTS